MNPPCPLRGPFGPGCLNGRGERLFFFWLRMTGMRKHASAGPTGNGKTRQRDSSTKTRCEGLPTGTNWPVKFNRPLALSTRNVATWSARWLQT